MNKIYLFGKIISKSKLKYIIEPKLKVYIELIIQTICGDTFSCIINEEALDGMVNLKEKDYVYISGYGSIKNNLLQTMVIDIYKFH